MTVVVTDGNVLPASVSYYLAASTPLGLLLLVLVSGVLPALVDIVTHRMTTGGVKSSVLLALSLVSGVVLEWLNAVGRAQPFDYTTALLTAVTAFVIGTTTFFGLGRPLNVLGANGVIAQTLPGGIGGKDPLKALIPGSNTVIVNNIVQSGGDQHGVQTKTEVEGEAAEGEVNG